MNATQAFRLAAALGAVLLLFGCDAGGEQPVNVGVDNTATPSVSAQATMPSAAPDTAPATAELTPTPVPVAPPAWSFPMMAAGLFGTVPPEGFAYPLHLYGDSREFLYATTDGRVLRASWDGSAYTSSPIAENLDIDSEAPVYVDAERGWLFAPGSKLLPGGRVDPAIVMVNLATSERCNVAELAGWTDAGTSLSDDYQYCDGFVLSRLQEYRDGKYVKLDRWAVVDVQRKAVATLDMAAISPTLPGVPAGDNPRLAFAGKDALLAIFTSSQPASGGGAPACIVYLLGIDGSLVGQPGAVKGAGSGGGAAIARGAAFSASPDGRRLLYSREGSPGIYLYELGSNEERALFAGAARLAFTQWMQDGSVLCGVELQPGGEVTVFQTAFSTETGAPKPTPTPRALESTAGKG